MRALQYQAYGGPEVLEWAEAPDPHAGAGQIRIAVRAASVNPIDWKAFSGAMSGGEPMAGTGYLGSDAAGVVDEVGEGVTGVAVGDEVFGRGRNTQAEYAVLDSWAAKPPAIDWAVAAAAGVAGETGERGLRLLDVKAGDTLFVDGGAGGVGAVTVQLALARGAKVIASASEANHDYLREIGATPVRYGPGLGERVPGRCRRPGRRGLRCCGQDPGPGPDQLGPRAVPGGEHRQLHRRPGRRPRHRWRRRQSPHAGPGPGRRPAGTEQAGDQGADVPVRPRRRAPPHQPVRPRPRQARPDPLTTADPRPGPSPDGQPGRPDSARRPAGAPA
jgi:hypothetical protein